MRHDRLRGVALRRDMYLCAECKRYGKSISATVAHHINPVSERPDLQFALDNIVSLCGACHNKMHDRDSDTLTDAGEQLRRRLNRERKIYD